MYRTILPPAQKVESYRHLCPYSSANRRTLQFEQPHVLCVNTGRSSETAKAHRG
eukprot:TRINITY_DN5724_c0_g1_i1.p3 TRINITY_DN5724_c0_g1~~TRINITY_DN5724_c0_g1_i1.p3  ORF type:complete len:54 (+),score=16.81 TRINITY_DN5724_c0_g1_i1:699-860(+)